MTAPRPDAELRRFYASAPAERRLVDTLELSHPLFPQTYFVTKDSQVWTFLVDGEPQTFLILPFTVKLPTTDGKGQQDLEIVLDNVGREAMDAIEAASFLPTTNIAVVLRRYLDVPESAPKYELRLAVQSLVIDPGTIQMTATRADTLNKPFPTELYRVDLFPGLDR
jgi:hypothetical protein